MANSPCRVPRATKKPPRILKAGIGELRIDFSLGGLVVSRRAFGDIPQGPTESWIGSQVTRKVGRDRNIFASHESNLVNYIRHPPTIPSLS